MKLQIALLAVVLGSPALAAGKGAQSASHAPAKADAGASIASTAAGASTAPPSGPQKLQVDPEHGNNTFSAVFDAPLGERINAVSSHVGCDLTLEGTRVSGSCTVPLTSIMVDNEPTKTEHFQQWSTNKKVEPAACSYQAKLDGVVLSAAPAEGKPATFTAQVPFTVCGRARTDGGKETVTGTAMLVPGASVATYRIRARIEHFNREQYQVGPRWTEGWLSRVQQLGPVVAPQGTVELSLFARAPRS